MKPYPRCELCKHFPAFALEKTLNANGGMGWCEKEGRGALPDSICEAFEQAFDKLKPDEDVSEAIQQALEIGGDK